MLKSKWKPSPGGVLHSYTPDEPVVALCGTELGTERSERGH